MRCSTPEQTYKRDTDVKRPTPHTFIYELWKFVAFDHRFGFLHWFARLVCSGGWKQWFAISSFEAFHWPLSLFIMWEKLENIRNIATMVQIVEESLCGTNSVWTNRILGLIQMERERKFSEKKILGKENSRERKISGKNKGNEWNEQNTGNCLQLYRNVWRWSETVPDSWLWLEVVEDGLRWLNEVERGWKGWSYLKIRENDWKWTKMVRDGQTGSKNTNFYTWIAELFCNHC